jgi:transcription antitermination factor NusG
VEFPVTLRSGSSVHFTPPVIRMNPDWVALVVRPRAERSVQKGLANMGLETFVAWHGVRRRWADRIKILEQNLIPGYIFCQSTFAERLAVMHQVGVERVVSFNRTPALIPDEEIAALRRAVCSELPLGPWPYLKAGQRVRIEKGVLAGMEGTLARESAGWRVVVSVSALQRSVAVEIDRDMIAPESLDTSLKPRGSYQTSK